MNAAWIITVFVSLDELRTKGGQQDQQLSQVGDAEVLTVAVVAAKCFQNHHERALLLRRACHYLAGNLSISRFNRRLHACRAWLEVGTEVLCAVATRGAVFIIDSFPVPVCKKSQSAAVSQSARLGLLRLLCGKERKVLRFQAASELQ